MTAAIVPIRRQKKEEEQRAGPSESFVRLTRNPDIAPPTKVVRTVKSEGDICI